MDIGLFIKASGYGLVAVGFGTLAALTFTRYKQRLQSGALALALVVTSVWGVACAADAVLVALPPLTVFLLESGLDLVWLIFFASLMAGAVGGATVKLLRYGAVGLGALVMAGSFALAVFGESPGARHILVPGQILTSLAGLVIVEQVFRNARAGQRRGVKFLCLGVATLFVYDLMLYSLAVAAGALATELWIARGFVVTLTLPLIVLALRRSPMWAGGIFVSRHVVFYSTMIFAAGIYLAVVGFVGQWLRSTGQSWDSIANIVFLAAALLLLLVLLLSSRIRRATRTFFSKHFFENKYDYRTEWLRLIRTLTQREGGLPLQKCAVKALCDITDSPAGLLWLYGRERRELQPACGWNKKNERFSPLPAGEVSGFFEAQGWIVDLAEYSAHPARYESLKADLLPFGVGEDGLLVPLIDGESLIGLVALDRPLDGISMTYEDRDLLKTAGRQIAGHLAQERAMELLAQSRQFEAYNRLTAYLMHDLKNIIAQQSLLLENARKHSGNPAFIADAMETIRGGVVRMKKVMEQLRQGSLRPAADRVELGAIVMTAVSMCADRQPVPTTDIGDARMWVRGDRDRLQMAIVHAIRNAQDATPADGQVTVAVRRGSDEADCYRIDIIDEGAGMAPDFVRERLFKPFDSTKGAQGMGIGAYQIRETARFSGGSVDVRSTQGQGTTLSLRLPVAQAPPATKDSTGAAV